MYIDYRHAVSILEIIVYSPTLFLSIWITFRHGFSQSTGWLYFIIFCLARIVGSACHLATIQNPDNIGLYITWAVCTSLGLSPLLLACIGLLSWANDPTMRKTAEPFNPVIFRLAGIPTITAAILSIIGTTASSNISNGLVKQQTKLGLVFYLIAWIIVGGLFLIILQRTKRIENGENRLLLAVGISLPLIFVRLMYSYIYAFGHKSEFNMITGDVTIQLVMSVLAEMVAVLVCLGIGLTLQVRPAAKYTQQRNSSNQHDDELELANDHLQGETHEKRQTQRRKQGDSPITMLVTSIEDSIRGRTR
ncbi:unnamed protein product [Penicillium glandicola]